MIYDQKGKRVQNLIFSKLNCSRNMIRIKNWENQTFARNQIFLKITVDVILSDSAFTLQ